GEKITFHGFPRQWLPLFAWCNARWQKPSEPDTYLPLISDLSLDQLEQVIATSKAAGQLRVLVESIVCLDPVLADALYIVDNKAPVEDRSDAQSEILLTSWASYGSPKIRSFEKRALECISNNATAVFLPCSRRRPYNQSTTHKRIWSSLEASRICNARDENV